MKRLLVHADLGADCPARLQYAAQLAQLHGAALHGIYIIPPFELAGYSKYTFPKEVLEERNRAERAEADAVREVFEETLQANQIRGQWQVETGEPVETLAGWSRTADMLVIGQRNPDDPKFTRQLAPERVILRSGRPVVVTPYVRFALGEAGTRVLLAWDGSREAARSMHDALPLLSRAASVNIVRFTEDKSAAATTATNAALVGFLADYGIRAEAESHVQSDISVGEALLNRAVDLGSNLIVAGAYGQSRLREVSVGGVTRILLKHLSVPVLMSR
ncbi:universal stress protein [Granulosicoccaceae sp. 1_MG-2023]|nr:universal stress protein [Granulosicoccaceae sp. 1_MG-2023]